MKNTLSVLLSLLCILSGVRSAWAETDEWAAARLKANQLQGQGNYNDALEAYKKFLQSGTAQGEDGAQDLDKAISCLQNLSRIAESDDLIEQAIVKNKESWRLLRMAAYRYYSLDHNGSMVAGKYNRGPARGGQVRYVSAFARDRVRAIQLYLEAGRLAREQNVGSPAADAYVGLAEALLNNMPWKLQAKTDISKLPDYDEQEHYGYYGYGRGYGGQGEGAPVDQAGNPVFYRLPASFEEAASDGERWRWALAESVRIDPSRKRGTQFTFAQFLNSQFGAQTFSDIPRGDLAEDESDKKAPGVFSLQTLTENETIANLASGIKRFTLPDEFNFLRILHELSESKDGYQEQAIEMLAQIYEDRRQYDRAAAQWQRAIELFGPGSANYRQKRLDQIVGAWGRFEAVMSQAAGKAATVDFRFRNGTSVAFEAHEIKVEKLLTDTIEFLKSNPRELDYQKVEINNIGYRLVEKDESRYLGEKVASWSKALTPAQNHFDRRVTVETPLKKAGAYLVTARMAGGNLGRIIIWLNDGAIVKKRLNNGVLYYVADATTGKPIEEADLQFFGYRQEYIESHRFLGRPWNIITSAFSGRADAQGQFLARDGAELNSQYQWLVIAKGSGRFAYLGFGGVWGASYYDQEYSQAKIYGISDRPVYRPGNNVKYKVWLRHARYDEEQDLELPRSSVQLQIFNPKSEKILEKTVELDRYGGYEGSLELGADAALGVYRIVILNRGQAGTFRVEEYKKPEFEVKIDAPTEPVMLGEKIKAKITAKYYFGAPVSKAKVHYKVQRFEHAAAWYPVGIWDWFYGVGYWWFSYDYRWYPGWDLWGCKRPLAWWFWSGQQNPPELVQEREVDIGNDGTFDVLIDTLAAKELHGDSDHRYEISAEVTDDSRRMISGSGSVLVARKPFKVYAWVDRGYYRVGDTVQASFSASTLDQKPVKGTGVLKLLSLTYDSKGIPQESTAQQWSLATNDDGRATQQMIAAKPGQYRLSYTLTDKARHSIEGGYVFTVIGDSGTGKDFRFNEIELIPDKREYAPGDKLKLQINTDQANATVLLFLRPANGAYLKPEVIRLEGKSVVREVEITKKDMPNFYIEALTVHNGAVYQESKEIVVPPEKRVLNVEVLPSAEKYKPNEEARVKLKVTDFFGKPFSGTAVLSVYDKSVEYISGGSNVPEIKEFFWKWRRQHQPTYESNLMRQFANLLKSIEVAMSNIGVHGGAVSLDKLGMVNGRDTGATTLLSRGKSMQDGFLVGGEMAEESAAKDELHGFAAPSNLSLGSAVRSLEDIEKKALPASAPPQGQPQNAAAQPAIRKDFADTAFWKGTLDVPESGIVEMKFNMPENLTTWKIRSWVLGTGTRVGEGTAEVVTTKNLVLRLQAPRFFVEKDEVVLSANVHNYLKGAKRVKARIELPGDLLALVDPAEKEIQVGAGGEARVDWRVQVKKEGEAKVRMFAITDEESDAVEIKLPVYVHGMLKTESFSGVVRGEKGRVTFKVPEERRLNQSRLEVRYSPTLAGAMVDALPYLVNYPYGCTEQTLNRFLPTIITAKVLRDMGVNLAQVKEKRTNLNAQEIGDDKARAAQWKRYEENPVFDEAEVERMVRAGIDRLTSMQLSDGGWGWFSGWGEQSSAHLTAYVVHGLQIARTNGAQVSAGVIERGVEWLRNYEAEQLSLLRNAATKTDPYKDYADNLDAFVQMVLLEADKGEAAMREFLYRDRTHLAVYGKAMLGIIFSTVKDHEKLTMMLENLKQYLVQDPENQTAYLNLGAEGYWWYWYGSEYEAQAYYLKLLVRTNPKSEVAAGLVKYLINNRKHATYWNSTRDTAVVIEAFAEFLKASGEYSPDMSVSVLLDGKNLKEVRITKENLFTFDNKFMLEGAELSSGAHTLELRRSGKGPLYFNAYLTNFTLEDPITKAGLEIKVNRKYYKLVREEASELSRGSRGQAIDEKVEKYRREELLNLDQLKSGDKVEVELEIDSKNDYEYLLFEDMKPAGFEPLDVRSGYNGNDMGAYVEFRDERVAFFVRSLPRGKRSVSYRMRAEIPGSVSALPAKGSAMYAPELKANSDEIKLKVVD